MRRPSDRPALPLPAAVPIGLLAAAGFLSSAAARVIDPLLHVVADDFGATVPQVSVVIAAYTLPYGLCQILIGPLGDRYGKLRVILAALCGYVLAATACAAAAGLAALTAARVLGGMASAGLIPACLAYIGDSVPYQDRQVTISRFLTGAVLAQMLAGPIGGVFGQFIGWRGVFLALAGAAAIVAGTLALRLHALPDRRGMAPHAALANYARLLRSRSARTLLLLAALDGIVLVGCFPFLAPWMTDAFGLSYGAVGLILAAFGLGALAYTRLAGRLLRALGEAGMVLTGGALMAASVVAAVAVPVWQPFPLIELALGLGFFMLHSVLQARATELLPDARSTAVATFALMLLIGQGLGALGAGALIGCHGYRVAFLADAAGIAVLAVLAARAVAPRGYTQAR